MTLAKVFGGADSRNSSTCCASQRTTGTATPSPATCRAVHPRERAAVQRLLPIELVEEIMGERAIAEEQPAFAGRFGGAALLHEGTEWRDTGAGTDHDDVLVGRRQAEMPVRLDLHPHVTATLETFGHVVRCNTLAGAAMTFVAHSRNQQMRFIPHLTARRCDRISARRQGAGQRAQRLGVERNREGRDQIDELAARDPLLDLSVGNQRLDVLVTGLLRICFNGFGRQRRHVARLDEFATQPVVTRKAGRLQQLVDIGRIIFGIEIE